MRIFVVHFTPFLKSGERVILLDKSAMSVAAACPSHRAASRPAVRMLNPLMLLCSPFSGCRTDPRRSTPKPARMYCGQCTAPAACERTVTADSAY
ncbi:hypothetical protein GDO78_022432 [Eleutherodactylus coqui]|uniref:Uncharacterized protein n=1 Tax=Eleutherodactylus coqui TaxID=57060 RepID=A0A8J6E9J6_ELECQ|nr:hypothetical protein GDO78_022432 [Eleutherodactylus coqui]